MPKQLQDIGLSDKEARVYISSLELGPTTADKLAKHAKVNRSTTYVQLESLMKSGLISTYEENKKTFFAPESPEFLKRLLARQRENITSKERDLIAILPVLLQQYAGAGEKPVVRFCPGKEGITAVREEVLSVKDKELYVIFSYDNMTKLFSPEELDQYTDRRKALGIHSKGIYTFKEFFDKADLDNLTERRFLRDLPLTVDIRIFGDKTAIFSLTGNLFGMVIESKQIASSMKMIFNFLWQQAEGPKVK